ncbi:MAG TPA: transglycosylase domain-containing protein [Clostridia bacterium]|nr:transglycosylase domain-containing protein [Clostridia bacterium]
MNDGNRHQSKNGQRQGGNAGKPARSTPSIRRARHEEQAESTRVSRRVPLNDRQSKPNTTHTSRRPNQIPISHHAVSAEIRNSRKYKAGKRELRKRVKGRPTHSMSVVSVPMAIWSSIRKALLVIVIILLTVAAFLGGSGLGVLSGYISTAQSLEISDVKKTYEATNIYDRNGEQAAVLTGSQNILREYVPIAVVKPTYLDDAFIAIEDERFDTHHGIDPKRIASAVGSLFINLGSDTHGASTITQQVVKMMSGADVRSAQRKIQEWERAIDLEKRLSKDEIMELFVNMVPMGGQYVGVQSAAKAYFGKEVPQLDLAECAFLAGIPNLPSIYNPSTEYGKRNALRRMRITLSKMLELGKITETEYQDALDRELVFRTTERESGTSSIHSYFVDAVINEVIEQLIIQRGYSRRLANVAVFQHGLTIETTMDPRIQRLAEESFKKKELFSFNYDGLPDSPQVPQAGITIISNDPDSLGQIVALVGGFGSKKTNLGFNRATQAYRQPGSSIKPILVYAPAIDIGAVTAASVLIDEEKHLDPRNPDRAWPQNSDRRYEGPVTIRHALRHSLNTIAVEVYTELLTPSIGLSYLQRMGVNRTNEPQPAGAIGAFGRGMTTVEMAGAFSTLANHGIFTKPYLFTRVLDAEGNVLLEHKPRFEQVFSPETADIMTNLLVDTLRNAPWIRPYSSIGKQPAAGKTGTSDERNDRWFCGYTPYYTAAVWYGFDNAHGRRMEISRADTPSPIRIWADIMSGIHEELAVENFTMSNNVVSKTVCAESGMLPTKWCPKTITEFFDSTKQGTFPQVACPLHGEDTEEPTTAPAGPTDPEPSGPDISVVPVETTKTPTTTPTTTVPTTTATVPTATTTTAAATTTTTTDPP